MNHNSSTLTRPVSYQIKTTVAVLLVASLLPLVVHLIPAYQGIPIGALLLPMFYVPFMAIVLFSLPVGLIAAALAPAVNFLLTGNPHWQLLAILTFELVIFVLVARALLQHKALRWIAAPLSYAITKAISSAALLLIPILPSEPVSFFITSVTNGVAGIFILALLNGTLLWHQQLKQ